MPKGCLSPLAKLVLVSATPSPSASRIRTIRLALGLAEPTFFMSIFWKKPLIPWFDLPALLGSVADSAARTSPFGSTSSQRGWSRPSAKRVTVNPGGALGAAPADQPTTSGTPMVGIRLLFGAFSGGLGPKPTKGSLDPLEQPAAARKASSGRARTRRRVGMGSSAGDLT